MRKVYLISYSLKGTSRDYSGFFNTLKNFPYWWNYLDSTWLISTHHNSAPDVYNELASYLNTEDYVFVVEISSSASYEGWLPQDAWDWLRSHL